MAIAAMAIIEQDVVCMDGAVIEWHFIHIATNTERKANFNEQRTVLFKITQTNSWYIYTI